MTTRTIPSESVEHIQLGVQTSSDPTGGTVDVGFSDTEDAPTTWFAGEWTDGQQVVPIGSGFSQVWVAQFLIGEGDLDLDEGTYIPWVRVVANGETLIRSTPDRLVIT